MIKIKNLFFSVIVTFNDPSKIYTIGFKTDLNQESFFELKKLKDNSLKELLSNSFQSSGLRLLQLRFKHEEDAHKNLLALINYQNF